MCTVRVRVPADTQQPAEEAASRVNAREVLDSQLRLASAGSARSLGSAGSQRSVSSAGSTRPDPGALPEVGGSAGEQAVITLGGGGVGGDVGRPSYP